MTCSRGRCRPYPRRRASGCGSPSSTGAATCPWTSCGRSPSRIPRSRRRCSRRRTPSTGRRSSRSRRRRSGSERPPSSGSFVAQRARRRSGRDRSLALRQRTWRVAVVSAALCRELARARGLPPEDAYTCGLLHDVGRLAAFVALERVAAGRRPLRAVSLPRWERLADRWHVALGAAFAERHRLPRAVFDAIAFHHRERTGAGAPSPLLRVVRTVDVARRGPRGRRGARRRRRGGGPHARRGGAARADGRAGTGSARGARAALGARPRAPRNERPGARAARVEGGGRPAAARGARVHRDRLRGLPAARLRARPARRGRAARGRGARPRPPAVPRARARRLGGGRPVRRNPLAARAVRSVARRLRWRPAGRRGGVAAALPSPPAPSRGESRERALTR